MPDLVHLLRTARLQTGTPPAGDRVELRLLSADPLMGVRPLAPEPRFDRDSLIAVELVLQEAGYPVLVAVTPTAAGGWSCAWLEGASGVHDGTRRMAGNATASDEELAMRFDEATVVIEADCPGRYTIGVLIGQEPVPEAVAALGGRAGSADDPAYQRALAVWAATPGVTVFRRDFHVA